jgi:hypothetical protein
VPATVTDTALSDADQQQLIAMELGLDEDSTFMLYLQRIWPGLAGYAKVNGLLRPLWAKKRAIQWLMGRSWKLTNWKFADSSRNQSDVMKNLKLLADQVQGEIDDLIGKAMTRSATIKDIALITPLDGPLTFVDLNGPKASNVTNNPAGPGVPTKTAAAAVVTNTPPAAPKPSVILAPAEAMPPLTDWSSTLSDGGFSQEVMPENPLRTYLLLVNTGTRTLWWEKGQNAIMGEARELARGERYEVMGAATPTLAITIVGAQAGSPFQALAG